MTRRPWFHVALVAMAVLGSVLLEPSAVAGTASADLSASRSLVTSGASVTLSGTVAGDPTCEAGRAVRLKWRGAGTSGFAIVGESTTASDGSYAFEATEPTTGRFRAAVLEDASCAAVTSNDVIVRVRVLVDASVAVPSNEAGSCVQVSVATSPAKPGQDALLQRRAGGGWTTIQTITLNGDGAGLATPCLAWDDIGVVRYRIRWEPQDALNETGTSVTLAFQVVEAAWMQRIDDLVARRPISVSVGDEGAYVYRHLDQANRTPASNEKLLLSMTLLDTFGTDHRIPTEAAARSFDGRVVDGDLWLLGRGDPLVNKAELAPLADQLVDAGLERVTGRVMGSTGYFSRDWDAPGWNNVATDYINRPTALTFEGNHDPDPEREAAAALTKLLEQRGVTVRGQPDAGGPPRGLDTLATVESKPLTSLLRKMLRPSWNFAAEVLGKGLGAEERGTPGTIAKGAATVEAWVDDHGADFSLYDDSGLSYRNTVDAGGIVRLLWAAEASDWGDALRQALPTGGQGTLRDRLRTVKIRAKTGTLTDVSALSGWVWANHLDRWIEFSILSDLGKPTATRYEDKIVRILANSAG